MLKRRKQAVFLAGTILVGFCVEVVVLVDAPVSGSFLGQGDDNCYDEDDAIPEYYSP